MIDKINALPYMQNPEVSIVISAQAKEIVSQWRQEVLENLIIQFEVISKLINNFYTESLAANVDIKSLNHKIIVTKNSLNVIMQNPLQALTVPKMTKEILLLHNIDPTEGIAAIDSQLTYISFIQQLQPNNQNDNISKGFYCILETISSIESIITLKMQDNFTKQIELSNIKNDAIQQQMNSLIQSVSYKDQQINNLVRRLDDETNPEKVALREHEIELARKKLKEKILREAIETRRKEHEEWLKKNPPKPDKTCLIFHHKIKCDNDFLNLTSKQQQKILNETNWSFEQARKTVEVIKQEASDFDIYQMFEIDVAGQDIH